MPHAPSLNQRRAGQPRAILPLIHRNRIDDVRIYAAGLREPQRQHRTQIAGMFAPPRLLQLLDNRIIDEIGAASHRRQEPASSSHC